MATPLTDSINALTAYANEVTGKQDATLSDAVGSLVEGYGGGDSANGTITPTSTSSALSIDTGKTGWTHFLIVPHKLPYDTEYVRCLGSRYLDYNLNVAVYVYGPSSERNIPNTVAVYTENTTIKFSEIQNVTDTVVTFTNKVIASQSGAFQAGTQYDWRVW